MRAGCLGTHREPFCSEGTEEFDGALLLTQANATGRASPVESLDLGDRKNASTTPVPRCQAPAKEFPNEERHGNEPSTYCNGEQKRPYLPRRPILAPRDEAVKLRLLKSSCVFRGDFIETASERLAGRFGLGYLHPSHRVAKPVRTFAKPTSLLHEETPEIQLKRGPLRPIGRRGGGRRFSIVPIWPSGCEAMQIHLQDGFNGESVVIRVDGREVFRDPNVASKRLTGTAGHVAVQVASGDATVEIELKNTGLKHKVHVPRADATHLTFFVDQGKLKHAISSEPFGSM
jgi:hypothetical protein